MKVYVDNVRANRKDFGIEDAIQDIHIGSCEGITTLAFNTTDKYVDVTANGTSHGPDYSGQVVEISPLLYHEHKCINDDLDMIDNYLNHPDYYRITLVIEGLDNVVSVTTPLKHEYVINFIDYAIAFNYDFLEEAEVIEMID